MSISIPAVLQVIVALGLLNVWLLRGGKSTDYRGGVAKSLKEEFAVYGLPPFVFYVVGGLKITSAILILGGLWIPSVAYFASLVIVFLMLGALAMHVKVKDPLKKSAPAFLMLVMSAVIAFAQSSQ